MDERYLRRAGLDYWQYLDWEVVDDWATLRSRLPQPTPWLFTKTAQRPYTDVPYRHGDVLVFGSETQGLPKSMLEGAPDRVLGIPMRAEARSLNLACAVAIAAYEALRQIKA
jgi:tRNA (cytidine/uridine-2'-O-)-methyltransferase